LNFSQERDEKQSSASIGLVYAVFVVDEVAANIVNDVEQGVSAHRIPLKQALDIDYSSFRPIPEHTNGMYTYTYILL
jgi:hypothetical protein